MFSVLYLSSGPTEEPGEGFTCQPRGDMRFPGTFAKNGLPVLNDRYPEYLIAKAALVREDGAIGGAYEEI